MKASKKSAAKARELAKVRKYLRESLAWERGNGCQYPECPEPFTDMHEVLTRGRGGSPVDPENILLLCREHHAWVTTHETNARAMGLVRARSADEHRAAFRPWEV